MHFRDLVRLQLLLLETHAFDGPRARMIRLWPPKIAVDMVPDSLSPIVRALASGVPNHAMFVFVG